MTEDKKIIAPPPFAVAGHQFVLKITVGLLDSVQEATGCTLIPDDETQTSPVARMVHDHRLLGNVLWAMIETQAAKREPPLTKKEFLQALDGETLVAGWAALLDALVFFVQSRNDAMGQAFQATIEAEVEMLAAGAKQLTATLGSEATRQQMTTTAEAIGKQLQTEIKSRCDSFASNLPPL